MAWHTKDPAQLRRIIDERSQGRPLGRIKHSDFARAAGISETFAGSVLNGGKGCKREVAERLTDRLGQPYYQLADLFEER